MNTFNDGTYLKSADKERVFKQWRRFLRGDLKRTLFTKDLYQQLSLHWGFIAHFDIHGFHLARFRDVNGLEATLNAIEAPSRWVFIDDNCSGNADLHKAMHAEFLKHLPRLRSLQVATKAAMLRSRIESATRELNELEASLEVSNVQ